ncbi:MAG: methylated-DNA--protein-cysteine methyltransferase, partial [Polyangiaceae bacterium]
MRIEISTIATPIGNLPLAFGGETGETLYALGFDRAHLMKTLVRRFDPSSFIERNDAGKIGRVLQAYLDGDVRAIDAIAVDTGGTSFQRKVWDALRKIPVGTTVSY